MKATLKPCKLKGCIEAPPSKSMAHRYLIGAALSGKVCQISGVDYSEDILASMDCLRALGAEITAEGDRVTVNGEHFMQSIQPVLPCRESGSTLRFLIPLALCLGKEVTFSGSQRLLERPLTVYEELCKEKEFFFRKEETSLTLCGRLSGGCYQLRGDISSQFITGLIFALVFCNEDSKITILPPFESRSYVNLTISALRSFGAEVAFTNDNTITIKKSDLQAYSGKIEGDYSNGAFLDAFNMLGSEIEIQNLREDSLQGDKVYREYFHKLMETTPTLDISDCPDLGPVLFAVAALQNGATFTGTDRLKVKESDRGLAMHEELKKLGGGLIFGDNRICVPKQELTDNGVILDGHNDHRIVMALSVILSKIGGEIDGIEAVKKSYPGFFSEIQKLGAEVMIS
ncbi:MAG: 3-phosphoshikimate 1-carboxyvinyltransferase [Clostridia bacterium]|nr:3-phosphoshikimate 1-carboxyvinyltransferase [Clostridia bacterium]